MIQTSSRTIKEMSSEKQTPQNQPSGLQSLNVWEWIELNGARIRSKSYRIMAMCHVPAAQRDNLYDEIWSDVIVARLPRVFQLWKQYKGKNDLDRYVMNNVSGYVYKYLIARSKRLANKKLGTLGLKIK